MLCVLAGMNIARINDQDHEHIDLLIRVIEETSIYSS